MTAFKSLDDIEVAGKRVLVRVDLNVPMREGAVGDATRIDRVAPTLSELAARGARVIVASHFGRPKGKPVAAMSLSPLAEPLSHALGGLPVQFVSDCIGDGTEAAVAALAPGDVALLENLRFHPGEEANDPAFADALAALADLYVNDAFSAAHRAHASTTAVAKRLPSAAGRLMQAELEALGKALQAPERPVIAVVGGAKVSTKLAILANLIRRVDRLVIGGAMANTFLHAQGVAVGASLHEPDLAADARRIMAEAEGAGCAIVLPTDVAVTQEFREGAEDTVTLVGDVPANGMILDLGPETCARIEAVLAEARTLVWNGPLGAFEIAPFDRATTTCARAAARLTGAGRLLSVAGGGDTVAALQGAGVLGAFSYVSTAGGAFLEWLEGRTLPGRRRARGKRRAEERGMTTARRPAIVVHDLDQAIGALRAAATAAVPVTLWSAPGAASYAGLGFLRAVFEKAGEAVPEAEHDAVIDCAGSGVLAHEALSRGFAGVAFTSRGAMRKTLQAIADAEGRRLITSGPGRAALDLAHSSEPERESAAYLAKRRASRP